MVAGQKEALSAKDTGKNQKKSKREILSMLFHNRPVKAAMGSVIVNGGVQLIGGKSLVDTKLATLHFGAE